MDLANRSVHVLPQAATPNYPRLTTSSTRCAHLPAIPSTSFIRYWPARVFPCLIRCRSPSPRTCRRSSTIWRPSSFTVQSTSSTCCSIRSQKVSSICSTRYRSPSPTCKTGPPPRFGDSDRHRRQYRSTPLHVGTDDLHLRNYATRPLCTWHC